MSLLRALLVAVVLALSVYVGYRYFAPAPAPPNDRLTIYYAATDGETLQSTSVSLGPARDLKSVAFYAATQAVAGPPGDAKAIRFPAGTIVRSVNVENATATVDLSGPLASAPSEGGSFAESGEFKALVWTLTGIPGISAVQVTLDGAKVATLPGGNLELDEPLKRSSW